MLLCLPRRLRVISETDPSVPAPWTKAGPKYGSHRCLEMRNLSPVCSVSIAKLPRSWKSIYLLSSFAMRLSKCPNLDSISKGGGMSWMGVVADITIGVSQGMGRIFFTYLCRGG